ncbi:hypothetical protein BKA63DRAFT_137383 [Paraphoma chrysanthemicola]|nr:hypothetical protein BKA63DRAFT_137383 [Paraphoma chrysanthemicola]
MQVLQGYVGRQLSFEADALNAIVGALNTIVNVNLYGLPCWHFQSWPFKDPHHRFGLALYWSHTAPKCRRPGFPSWSPLGWKGSGGVRFQTLRSISVIGCAVESPYGKGDDDVASQELLPASQAMIAIRDGLAQDLTLTAWTCDLNLENIVWTEADTKTHHTQNGIRVVLPWNESIDVCIRPDWDYEIPNINARSHVFCVLITRNELDDDIWMATGRLESQEHFFLILDHHGTRFERIGSFCLTWPFRDHPQREFGMSRDEQGTPHVVLGDRSHLTGEPPLWFRRLEERTFRLG